jgi:hippurate hydrolase
MFVAQPSEESINGAKAMLADGLFKRFGKPDYAFALHVWPGPAGQVFYKPGAVSSSSYSLQITFNGRGGHGSTPSETIDPIMMASRFVVDVQSVISREKDPAAFGVVSIGSFQAGSAGNIIPDTATVRGTVRMQDAAVGERMADGIRRTAKAVADMAGAPAPTIALNLGAKAVINDPALTDRTAGVFRAAFGQDAVLLSEPMSGGEDFSDFIHEGVPSVFFRVGGSDVLALETARKGGAPVPVNHSPFFAPAPGPVIRSGVTAMSLAAMNVLAR